MQTQQQLEVQKRADAEQQQRLEAETELLRLQLVSVFGQIASFHSKFDDILRVLYPPSHDVAPAHVVAASPDKSVSLPAVAGSAQMAQLFAQLTRLEEQLFRLQDEKQDAIKAKEDAESQMLKASEIVVAVQRGRDEALLKEREATLQVRVLATAFSYYVRR